MTKLIKDFTRDVIPGTAGTPGFAGSPAAPGYWVNSTVSSQAPTITPTSVSQLDNGITDEYGRIIRVATYLEVQIIPALYQAASNLPYDPGELNFIAAVQKIVIDQIATGILGTVLAQYIKWVPSGDGGITPTDRYLAVWVLDGSYGICTFIGYTNATMPTQTLVT